MTHTAPSTGTPASNVTNPSQSLSSPTASPSHTANSSDLNARMDAFLTLSGHLLTLISHENSILAETGEFTFENYIQKKVAMMRDFENQAQFLLNDISKGMTDLTRGRILMEEVRRIRDALTVNSAFQMEQIQLRTKARQEKFKIEKFGLKDKETCH